MSTINWAFEAKTFPQPLQAAIDAAPAWLRNARKTTSRILGFAVDADYMDDEVFLDAWARSQDSALLSVLYGVQRRGHRHGLAAAVEKTAGDDSRISALRAACRRTSSTGHRTWVIDG